MKYFKWLALIIKALFLQKTVFHVSFTRESNNRWYVDFPNWPLSHDHLEMVAGADDLLNLLDKENTNHVSLEVNINKSEKYDIQLMKVHSALTKGAFYTVETPLQNWGNPNAICKKQLWLCPVTLTILGKYPDFIYFKCVN